MMIQRRPWQEELAVIDQTMKAISGVTDPESLVDIYWTGIGKLIPMHDYLERIRTELADFCQNAPPTDDQTLIALRCA